MPFEYAVRPFQSRDTFGRTILPAAPSFSAEHATLTWGSQHAVPGALPTPKSLGVNIACCKEAITQNSAEASPASISITGPDAGGTTIDLKRSDVVLAKKREQNDCDGWMQNNSYVAASVKGGFVGMADAIHASDKAFLPSGSNPDCNQKTTWKYEVAA